MQAIINLYASFNLWADKRITDAVALMSEEKTKQELKSSFTSIHSTLIHLGNAQIAWTNRIHKVSVPDIAVTDMSHSTDFIVKRLLNLSTEWEKFMLSTTEVDLLKPVSYKTIRGEDFTEQLFEIAMHVMNHATYHRGQMITMMRELGETVLPRTDLIEYVRRRKD
ncbi:DinB family protein [Pollutibacter soli]|uniref:DinB family protein n=1 Tax=Pollutibacter soli TaxID=3034157 RepID=UPI003013D235